jgi:hypothetical protein
MQVLLDAGSVTRDWAAVNHISIAIDPLMVLLKFVFFGLERLMHRFLGCRESYPSHLLGPASDEILLLGGEFEKPRKTYLLADQAGGRPSLRAQTAYAPILEAQGYGASPDISPDRIATGGPIR